MAPTVSLLVTAHRPDPIRFADALDGACGQRDVETEVVVVVDGSLGEGAEAVVEERTHDLTVLRPGRVGRAAALNRGIDLATGEYVAIQDADDRSHADRSHHQALLLADRDDLSLVAGGAQRRYGPPMPIDWTLGDEADVHRVGDRLYVRNPLVHSAVLFRRADVLALGGYDETRQRLVDYDLYLRLAGTGHGLGRTDQPVVAKYMHDDQAFEGDRRHRSWRQGPYRLALHHGRSLPWPRRLATAAGATAWVPARFARTALGQLRVRTARRTRDGRRCW